MVSKDQKVVKSLLKILKKKYRELPVLLGKKRPVLEHLIYASFLENTSIETANQSFALLERYFIDWNEIRVSTSSELASVFPKLYDPIRTGERIRRTLQFLFEKYFKFDLEELRSKNKGEVVQFLSDIPFLTHFIVDYVTHILFNSPVVPLDEGSLRVMRLLNQVQVNEQNREFVPIFDDEESDFAGGFPWIHELGAAFIARPDSSEVDKILTTVDPDVSGRSWISLVETTDDDPAEIAKKVAKREKKSKLSAILPLEEIDLDESGDPDIVVDDVSPEFGFNDENSWDNDEKSSTSAGEESSSESEKTKSSSRKTKKRERSAKSSSGSEQGIPSAAPSRPTASCSPDKESLVFLDELDAEKPVAETTKPKRKSKKAARSTELKTVVSDDANPPSLNESVSETIRSESVVAQTVETSDGVASSATVVVSETSVTTVVRNKKSDSTTKTESSSLVASSETIVKISTETIVSSDSISETTSKLEKSEKTTTRKSSRKNKEASPVADDSLIRERKPKNKTKKVQSNSSSDSSQDESSDPIQNNDEIHSNHSTPVSPQTQNKIVSPDVLMTENAADERDNGEPEKVRETSDVDSNADSKVDSNAGFNADSNADFDGNDSPESPNLQPETPPLTFSD